MVMLSASPGYLKASATERKRICNGCGSARAKFDFVPDTIWGLSISPACDRHDWRYYEGKTIEDKELGDREYMNNMIRLIDDAFETGRFKAYQKWLKKRRYKRAAFYYDMVVKFGGKAFWSGKL